MHLNANFVAGLVLLSPCLAAGEAPPFVAKADEDLGALMLHFKVDGRDRLFFVDSGADVSTYDPKQWSLKKGQKQLVWSVQAGDKSICNVTPVASQGMPLYDSTMTRPSGILGRDFLDQVVLMFDRHSETALLWRSKEVSAQSVLAGASWPVMAGPHRWSLTQCQTSQIGSLDVKFAIDSNPLTGTLDTGCSDTVVAIRSLRALSHWPYTQIIDSLWDQKAAQSFSLVSDLKLPFLEVPIASVGDMTGDQYVNAWIGEDFLNRGRWVMDIGHRQFAFQAYEAKPDVRLHLPGTDVFMKAGGGFLLRPSFRSADSYPLQTIGGQEPAKALGPYPSAATKDRVQGLAKTLKTLLSQDLSLVYLDGNLPAVYGMTPWNPGKLATVEQIAVKENWVPALDSKPASYVDARGAKVLPDLSSGSVVLPNGTKVDRGDWSVSHTDKGSIILSPPKSVAGDGFEATLCVYRWGEKKPVLMDLPGAGGEIVVPHADLFIGPKDWPWTSAPNGSLIFRLPKDAGASSSTFVWLLASGAGRAIEKSSPQSAKSVPADAIATLPAGWYASAGASRIEMRPGTGGPTKPETADMSRNRAVVESAFLIRVPSQPKSAQQHGLTIVILAPKGWAVQRDGGTIVLVSPSGSTTVQIQQ